MLVIIQYSINNIRTTGTGTTSRTTGINSNTDLRDNNVTGARTTTNKTLIPLIALLTIPLG